MTKSEIRPLFKAKRGELSFDEINDLSLEIANQLLPLKIWQHTYYHLFLSIEEQNEVNTDYILNILSGKDKNIVISKSNFESGNMTNYLLTDNTKLIKNRYHIPEPVDGIEIESKKLEVIFVPLLACDRQGHRVGYGKGFYDQFLKSCPKNSIKIGLSFFEPIEEITDTFEGDIPLDYCITPHHVFTFNPA